MDKQMPKTITAFEGEYAFLSNFYLCPVMHGDILFNSSEAAFQAAKTSEMSDRLGIAAMEPSEAKKRGRKVSLRPDWEQVKDIIMHDILVDKFSRNPDLWRMLIATGDAILIEGNYWHDRHFGQCSCHECQRLASNGGQNMLGKMLMQIRDIYAMYWEVV